MDEVLIKNWNSVVGDTDVIYHLGDLALGASDRWDEILKRLNGYKVFVVGNHDRIFAGEKERQREKWDEKYHEWFDEVYDWHFIELDGETVNLSHFPYEGDSHDGDRYEEYRLHDNGNTLIHGHTHSKDVITRSSIDTLQIHVGVDAWNYTPVSEDAIIELMRENREQN